MVQHTRYARAVQVFSIKQGDTLCVASITRYGDVLEIECSAALDTARCLPAVSRAASEAIRANPDIHITLDARKDAFICVCSKVIKDGAYQNETKLYKQAEKVAKITQKLVEEGC